MSPRSVIEQARVPAIVRKRTTASLAEEAATELADNTFFRSTDDRLQHHTIYISAIQYGGHRARVTMTQSRGVERIGHLIIPALLDNPT